MAFSSVAVMLHLATAVCSSVVDPSSSHCDSTGWFEGSPCASKQADSASLLQVDALVGVVASQPDPAQRAEALKPLVWLHSHKCGSGLLDTIIHNPTLCPNTPNSVWMPDVSNMTSIQSPMEIFFPMFPEETYCPGTWSHEYELKYNVHYTIGSIYDSLKGHIVTTYRQPEQRLISMYFEVINIIFPGVTVSNLTDFWQRAQGEYVKQLTYTEFTNQTLTLPPPTEEQTALAVQRLREGVAFVGLTEEWDLSICLFHAMFGGPCDLREFHDDHLGTNRTGHEPYDTAMLEGFIDVHDRKVYAEAELIFEASLKQYGVTRRSCPSSCINA